MKPTHEVQYTARERHRRDRRARKQQDRKLCTKINELGCLNCDECGTIEQPGRCANTVTGPNHT